MVDSEFSEMQFVFDLMREMKEKFDDRLVGNPLLPTQPKEEQIGADVVIVGGNSAIPLTPVFLQFKRAKKLTRKWSTGWDDFGEDFYRFKIHTANQHNTLIDLNKNLGTACYVAPGFHTDNERIRHLRGENLVDYSISIECTEDSRVNGPNHKIAYTVSPPQAKMYSDPTPLESTWNIATLIDFASENGPGFESFESQQEAFSEFRHSVSEQFDYEIVPEEYEDDQIGQWIYKQKAFFLEYLDVLPIFVNTYGHEKIWAYRVP